MTTMRTDTQTRDEEIERKVSTFINDHFSDHNLSLVDFSRDSGYPPRTVQRALSNRKTSWRWLLSSIRMAYARKLLATTSLSVKDIANQVGYLQQAQFAAQYKRAYNQRPLDTRREARR